MDAAFDIVCHLNRSGHELDGTSHRWVHQDTSASSRPPRVAAVMSAEFATVVLGYCSETFWTQSKQVSHGAT
eukprot:9333442-Pyramimonas_sp.AAC.2